MCLDCGCGELNENHGDSRHLTMDNVKKAAEASEISQKEAIKNITEALKQADSQQGSSSGGDD